MRDSDDAAQQIEAMSSQIQAQVERATELQRALQVVEAEAASEDGSVKVQVNFSGALSDLKLTPEAMQLQPEQLSEEILQCCRAARSMLSEKMKKIADRIMGPGSETAEMISRTYAQRFAAPAKPENDNSE